jgi:hypothetical protein
MSDAPQSGQDRPAHNSFGQRAAGDPRSVKAINVGPPGIGPIHADKCPPKS